MPLAGLAAGMEEPKQLLDLKEIPWVKHDGDKHPILGDQIVLGLDGVSGQIELAPPKGSSDLLDLGWVLEIHAESKGKEIILIPTQSGKLSLPLLLVRSDSGDLIGRTQPLEWDIAAVEKKTEDPPDLALPASLVFPWKRILLWSLAGLSLLVGIIYAAWRIRRKLPEVVELPMPQPPAELEAQQALKALEASQSYQRLDWKRIAHRLSEILKKFLGRRHEFDALESTTAELINTLRNFGIEESSLQDLIVLFEELDRIKFTDWTPEAEAALRYMGAARKITARTSPQNGGGA